VAVLVVGALFIVCDRDPATERPASGSSPWNDAAIIELELDMLEVDLQQLIARHDRLRARDRCRSERAAAQRALKSRDRETRDRAARALEGCLLDEYMMRELRDRIHYSLFPVPCSLFPIFWD
jgi:hypothetical protein